MKQPTTESVLKKAKAILEKSGMTQDELGIKMGFETGVARRAVWQLFNKTPDPRFSTLLRLAESLGVELKDLL